MHQLLRVFKPVSNMTVYRFVLFLLCISSAILCSSQSHAKAIQVETTLVQTTSSQMSDVPIKPSLELPLKLPLELPIQAKLTLPKSCFTQGFTIDKNTLYLSCGKYGQSTLYIYRIHNQEHTAPSIRLSLLQKIIWPKTVFLEGIAITERFIYCLTWKQQRLFRLNKKQPSLATAEQFHFSGEGWGLSYVEPRQQLLLSNGSQHIFSISERKNQQQLQQTKTFSLINHQQAAHTDINELEVVNDYLFYNRWFDNHLYYFSLAQAEQSKPITAKRLNLETLANLHKQDGVLNGIAYHQEQESLWLTGKNWGVAYQLPLAAVLKMSQ